MKNNLLIVILSLLAIALSSCAKESDIPNWNDAELNWYSYAEGLKALNKSGKNGLFIIYANWCPTCKKYSKLFSDPKVVQALKGIILIRSDTELEPEISELFNIDGGYVPRTFALDKNGTIIDSLNSQNPKWWYFLPSEDVNYLIEFSRLIKQYTSPD